eukprot:m.18882 g.18882  ORF g.18882 m.18882 type:complete len:366 (+) comp6436_c0_seq1:63-1160(+)
MDIFYHQGLESKDRVGVHTTSNLLAASSLNSVFVASKQEVHQVDLNFPETPVSDSSVFGKVPLARAVKTKDAGHVYSGSSQIHTLTYKSHGKSTGHLASVDQFGIGCVSRDMQKLWSFKSTRLTENGWHGLTFPYDSEGLVVASGPTKELRLYNQREGSSELQCVSKGYSVQNPRAICSLGTGFIESRESLIAVAEGSQVSIWDLNRSQTNVARFDCGQGKVLTVSAGLKYLAASGAERVVNFYSPKKWGRKGSVKAALKYDVGFIAFDPTSDEIVFNGSANDSEVSVGRCSSGNAPSGPSGSWRGDSRWVGMSPVHDADTVFGLSSVGTLFCFHKFAASVSKVGEAYGRHKSKRLKASKTHETV